MPSLVGSLYVSLTADYSQYQRNMRAAEAVTARTAGGIRRQMGVTERSVTSLQRSMNSGIRPGALIAAGRSFDSVASRANLLRGSVFALTAAFGGLGAALTTNVISRYLDSFTGLENQMRVVSNGSADLAANINQVAGVAERSRSSIQAVATLYSRLAKAAPQEGVINTLRRVETINKALQLGGATAQEAASAAIQFSQAIASNRLGGEELRAVLETPLGLELAKGLGVTIGKFREMGYAGELTAEKLFKALDKISGSVNQQFARSVSTIDQALTVADGKITQFAGKLDDTYGITKILAGGILGLANNLETVVPLLATAGLGLGSAFAGRLAGGSFGRRVQAIRAEAAARKEVVRLAAEEAKATRMAADEAMRAARTASSVSADRAKELASPAAQKAYQRDLVALQKADADYLKQLEQRRILQYQLGAVTSQTTAGAIRAADALAAAENKVNEAVRKRTSLRGQLTRTEKRLAKFAGGTLGNGRSPDFIMQEQALQKKRAQIIKDLASVESRIEKERETAIQRRIRVTELGTEAERRAATERASILVREQQQMAAIERANNRRGVLASSLRASGAARTATGTLAISGNQLDATANLIKTEQAAARAASQLAAAARAATFTRQAFAHLGAAGSSLVGFLGGPWGVAFTAAIGVMTILGIRAQRSAEQIARARGIISEELSKLEEGGDATRDQRLAILSDKLAAERDRLESVQALLAETVVKLANSMAQQLAAASSLGQINFLGQYSALVAELEKGTITIDEFIKRLRGLGVSDKDIAVITNSFKGAIAEGKGAEQTVDRLRDAIARLNGQIAEVTIRVNIDDPRGIFQLPEDVATGNAKRLAEQYGQYGRGRVATRNQEFLKNQRESVLSAAGEQNSILNTPQKIRDRTQALYEEGAAYGLTRDEAAKLATAELNLAEKTRLAGQAGRSAAKDYENFNNKLEELQQRAAASGLSQLDQEVVQFAEKLRNGSQMMKQYIDAVNSGDLSKAPAELLKVRDALIQIEANSAADGILQQYGTGAQLAAVFAEKQQILNAAVASGKITADQAAIAYADFLGQFGQYEWIDQLSGAFSGFADNVISDFDSIGDAAESLLKELVKIFVQWQVLKPLENWLKGSFGGGIGGGSSFAGTAASAAIAGGGFVGLYHDGSPGVARGNASSYRYVPSGAFKNAPRFHSGIKSNELAAVLQRGEAVLNSQQQSRTAGVIGGLAGAVRGGQQGVAVDVGVSVDDNGKLQAYVRNVSSMMSLEAVKRYDKTSPVRFPRDAKNAKTRGGI